jgi:hypothetical protein
MSLLDGSERLVALPKDEALAESSVADVILVEGLRMRYGATEAVAGIDLRVARGEIFAFSALAASPTRPSRTSNYRGTLATPRAGEPIESIQRSS